MTNGAPPLRLDGRSVLVTGAGGGLGRSHAVMLAAHGAHVIVNDVGGNVHGAGACSEPAQRVVDEIRAAGGSAVADGHSVSDRAGAEAMVASAIAHFGRLDAVVNNAGILRDSSWAKMTFEQWDAVMDVHLRGAFCVLKAAWPHLLDAGHGRVVNTISDSGLFGNFGQANYGAAKAALIGLTRVLSIEGARRGVRVNGIAPVGATRMTQTLMTPEAAAAARPEQTSAVVTYLVSDECQESGEFFSIRRGRIRRVVIGLTEGIEDADVTPERVRDLWRRINDPQTVDIPDRRTN